jgi:hypothetical protein
VPWKADVEYVNNYGRTLAATPTPVSNKQVRDQMLGQYSFAVPDAVARRELRPLRNPPEDNI